MRLAVFLLLMGLLAAPALAQLDYHQGGPSAPQLAEEKKQELAVRIKKTRANETSLRPDWYGLFMAWTKHHPGIVLSGLRDQGTFDNFTTFMACDRVRDFRSNDVVWPEKQVEIVQKFNQRALNPQTRFRLLTYAVLGPYVGEQQQFVFRPLDDTSFSIKFPDQAFGIEDDCETGGEPLAPWPNEFVIGFKNPDFITALPMEKIKAEYFLSNLPKDKNGKVDRRVVVEIEFDVTGFPAKSDAGEVGSDRRLRPVQTEITARRAIVYADNSRSKELGRFGFPVK